MISVDTTKLRYHLRLDGMTYQGAWSVLVRLNMSS